jgi:hypothetical protein
MKRTYLLTMSTTTFCLSLLVGRTCRLSWPAGGSLNSCHAMPTADRKATWDRFFEILISAENVSDKVF